MENCVLDGHTYRCHLASTVERLCAAAIYEWVSLPQVNAYMHIALAMSHRYGNSRAIQYGITCLPAEITFPSLPQPVKAGTRFSDPRGMQGRVDLVNVVTYRGGIPARRS